MGEGGPHSPDSEGGAAATSEEGAESGKGAKSDEGDESVRRRPPLKRQITRNQSDPKILPVKIFFSDKTEQNPIDHGSSDRICQIFSILWGSWANTGQIQLGLSLASSTLNKMLPATIHVRFQNHGVYFLKLLKTEEEKRVSGLSGHPCFLFDIFYLGA